MATIGAMGSDAAASGELPRRDWALLIFLGALLVGVVSRIAAGWGLPLWLDETFTGTIAGQQSFAELIQWCLIELTGPAFYVPMWAWAKIAGTGDIALRAPSLIFSIATPLLIARYGHPDRNVRLFWAALTLLWLPVLPTATEARPYPQLLFLGTLQAILFVKVAKRADPKLAFWWGSVTALAVLTHYYALVIGGLQGMALLIGHRRDAFRLYPAVLPLGLMAAWAAYHLPFVLGIAAGHVTYYEPLRPVMLFAVPMFILGENINGFVVFGLLFLTRKHWKEQIQWASPEAQLIWAGIIAAVIIIAVGLIGATMMPRYLTPGIPALLFGLACWASRVLPRDPMHVRLAFVALIAAMLVNLFGIAEDSRFRERRHFEFETASAWLMERPLTELHFLWSTPTGAQAISSHLAQVAGFFFQREGKAVNVIIEGMTPDPSRALATAAASNPHSAILWISDNPLPKGVVPQVEQIDRRWECRDFGGQRILVYACRRRLS